MNKAIVLALCVALAAPGTAVAGQAADDLASKIVNDPGAPEVSGARAVLRDDPKVQGGKALRIAVKAKGEHPWDVSAGGDVKKPIKAGDNLVLAFWARLESGANGATSATLPFNSVQLSVSPYTPVIGGPAEIGPEWKMVEIRGKSDKDYAAGTLKVTLQLAVDRQTLDLGPIILLDLGQ